MPILPGKIRFPECKTRTLFDTSRRKIHVLLHFLRCEEALWNKAGFARKGMLQSQNGKRESLKRAWIYVCKEMKICTLILHVSKKSRRSVKTFPFSQKYILVHLARSDFLIAPFRLLDQTRRDKGPLALTRGRGRGNWNSANEALRAKHWFRRQSTQTKRSVT